MADELGALKLGARPVRSRHYKAVSMADETWLDSPVVCKSNIANTKPLRWLMKRDRRGKVGVEARRRRKYQAFTMADETQAIMREGARLAVANTKPLRWLMKLYPFKHLIILHAPPSLRELSAEAGQGMPNSL